MPIHPETTPTPNVIFGETQLGAADYIRLGGIMVRGLGDTSAMGWLPSYEKDERTGLLETQTHAELSVVAKATERYVRERTDTNVFQYTASGIQVRFANLSVSQTQPTALYHATIQPRHQGISLTRQGYVLTKDGHIATESAPRPQSDPRAETIQLLSALAKYHLDQHTSEQLRAMQDGQRARQAEHDAALAEMPKQSRRRWPFTRR